MPDRSPDIPSTQDKHPDVGSELLAIGEAAGLLGVSVDTLRRWARAGRIEASRTPTGHRRFRRADLETAFAVAPAYVYRVYDDDTADLLYIGSAHNPRHRLRVHRTKDWWPDNPRIEINEYEDRAAAYQAERQAISQESPSCNDDAAIESAIDRLISAPHLTPSQRDRLTNLLSGS